MYSVVLMAALTTNTATVPGFGGGHGIAHTCYGGVVYHSGGYGCWAACWGWDAGCYGGAGGFYGGCSGWFTTSMYGGCYGCLGGYGDWYGYGAAYAGDSAPYYPAANPMTAPPGTTTTTPPGATTPPTPPPGTPPATPPVTPPATTTPPAATTPPTFSRMPAAARIVVEKPADAKLFVDDRAVTTEGARLVFGTPTLDPTIEYFYTVRVEMTRDGKPVNETRRVIVRAGATVTETFAEPAVATAAR